MLTVGAIVAGLLFVYLIIAMTFTGVVRMTANAILQFSAYLVLLLLAAWPLGSYLARVYDGDDFWAARILGPTERLIYRLIGVNPEAEMDWKGYTLARVGLQSPGLSRPLRTHAAARSAAARSGRTPRGVAAGRG